MSAALTLSPAEAAERIGGVTERWLKDKAAANLIPHTRVGRLIRFTPADVEAIVANGHQDAIRPAGLRPTSRSRARRAS